VLDDMPLSRQWFFHLPRLHSFWSVRRRLEFWSLPERVGAPRGLFHGAVVLSMAAGGIRSVGSRAPAAADAGRSIIRSLCFSGEELDFLGLGELAPPPGKRCAAWVWAVVACCAIHKRPKSKFLKVAMT